MRAPKCLGGEHVGETGLGGPPGSLTELEAVCLFPARSFSAPPPLSDGGDRNDGSAWDPVMQTVGSMKARTGAILYFSF